MRPRARVGGLDPAPPPSGARAQRAAVARAACGDGTPSGRTYDMSPKAAPLWSPAARTRPFRATFAFSCGLMLSLREGSSCSSPSWFCSFGGLSVEFPHHCVPPPTTGKVCHRVTF